jgi:hypothetical protein
MGRLAPVELDLVCAEVQAVAAHPIREGR